jgi:hypothetical protein
MRILVITSCSGKKQHDPANQLTLDDFRAGLEHVKKRERDLQSFLLPAGQMYTRRFRSAPTRSSVPVPAAAFKALGLN